MHFSLELGLSLVCEMGVNVLIFYAYIPSHILRISMHGNARSMHILKNISTRFPFMEMY